MDTTRLIKLASIFNKLAQEEPGGMPETTEPEREPQKGLFIGPESHLDHGVSEETIGMLKDKYADCDGFFIDTLEVPGGGLECGLYGPIMGDPPVPEEEVEYKVRGGRGWKSRIVDRPKRPTNLLTVIAGPNEGHTCYLYTAFGGPLAPQEPGDPGARNPEESKEFWSKHALADEGF